jgi:hypothetical protein
MSHLIPSDCGIWLSLTIGVIPIACKIFGIIFGLSWLKIKFIHFLNKNIK